MCVSNILPPRASNCHANASRPAISEGAAAAARPQPAGRPGWAAAGWARPVTRQGLAERAPNEHAGPGDILTPGGHACPCLSPHIGLIRGVQPPPAAGCPAIKAHLGLCAGAGSPQASPWAGAPKAG